MLLKTYPPKISIQCLSKIWLFRITQAKQNTKTYYQILEVTTNASMANIKQNYLKLAKIYHPDVYKGKDQTRFPKIQQAYKALSDKVKRNKYDEQIGIKKPMEVGRERSDYQASAGQREGEESKSSKDFNKPKNTMQYDVRKQEPEEKIDLDEEYYKFFKIKPKTKFQQIVITEEPQIRGMTQAEKIRRHFSQTYQSEKKFIKITYQKEFDKILDDQINQKNRMYDDSIKAEKVYKQRHSEKGITSLKRKVFIGFVLLSVVSIPLLFSFATKYRIDTERMNKIEQLWKEANKEAEQITAAYRLNF